MQPAPSDSAAPRALPAAYLPGWADAGAAIAPLVRSLTVAGHPIPTLSYTCAHSGDYAAQVGAQLNNRSILIGWSMGGMVAIEAGLRFPDRIAGLILLASSLKFCDDDRLRGWPQRAIQRMRKACEADPVDTVDRFRRGLFTQAEWEAGALDRYLGDCQDLQPGGLVWSSAELLAGLDYLATRDLRAAAQDLCLPVLWLHGSADTVCPVGAMHAARVHRSDHTWTYRELPDAGHAVGCSQAAAVREAILGWPPWQMLCGDW